MARRSDHGADAPLLAWGETLRANRKRHQRRIRRAIFLVTGCATFGLTIALPPTPRLVWNASASAPIGLYWVTPHVPIDVDDMVIARMPTRFRMLAATRHYLPANVPLVKRAVGVAGDEICAFGDTIFLNGRPIATRRHVDGQGRLMPSWGGCERVRGRSLFLLMSDSPASFDGRYFGITASADVIGRARLLWPR
jgi:conjugative transfer signal peptidase TraF